MRTHAVLSTALTLTLGLSAAHAQSGTRAQPPKSGSERPSVDMLAPIPQTGKGPAIPQDKGYLVEEVRGGLFWVTDGVYQAMFLVHRDGVIVVDAPPNLGEKLLKAIREKTSKPVTHLVYSHAHADHIGAANLFPKGIQIVAHEQTAQLLAQVRDPNRPMPTLTFRESHTLSVGGQVLQLDYKGVNHEPGNIFIYAPAQRVLMLVDIVFPGWVPFAHLAVSDFIPGYVAAADQALQYPFEVFLGGHLTRPGTREDVMTHKAFVADLKDSAAQALKTVDFKEIAKQVGFENPRALFDRYLDAVAQDCTQRMLPKWTGRLAGADVFMYSHCWTMMESLRIDYGQ